MYLYVFYMPSICILDARVKNACIFDKRACIFAKMHACLKSAYETHKKRI